MMSPGDDVVREDAEIQSVLVVEHAHFGLLATPAPLRRGSLCRKPPAIGASRQAASSSAPSIVIGAVLLTASRCRSRRAVS